jgi:PST family polysaccharide transporter
VLQKIISHNVARNSAALFILQLINMIAPLIVLPYLSRVLGLDGFGLVMFALSVCAIALVITDFGFNLSATYSISKRREDKTYVNELIGAIFLIKVGLFLLFLFSIIVFSYFKTMDSARLLLSIYISLNVLFQAFLPTWFFQGIEKMKNVTVYMFFAKISYIVLVFICISDKSDVELVILLYAMSNLIAVILSLKSIYSNGYSIKRPLTIKLKDVFKESVQFFISRAAVSIYTSASTFLVGAIAGVQQLAIFGASEKIYQASKSVTAPVAQALFPYMAKTNNTTLLMKVVLVMITILSIVCLSVGFWANEIMGLIFGDEFIEAGAILQLFLIITIINFLSVNFGYPAFAGIGKVHIANYTVVLGAVVHLILLFFLYIWDEFTALNVVKAVLITESIVMLLRLTYFKKNYKNGKKMEILNKLKKLIDSNIIVSRLFRRMYKNTIGIYFLYRLKKQFRSQFNVILNKVVTGAEKQNIQIWPAFGTLLGLYREGGPIEHDFDIDFGAWYKDKMLVNKLLTDLGAKVCYSFHSEITENAFEECYELNGCKFDVFYFTEDKSSSSFKCHDFMRHNDLTREQTIRKYGGLKVRQITLPFSGFIPFNYQNITILMPLNTASHLEARYGAGFMTPDTKWVNSSPNPNITDIGFEGIYHVS